MRSMPDSGVDGLKKSIIMDKVALIFIGFSGLLVFLLPENILDRYEWLRYLVNLMGEWFPHIEELGRHVSIPQVAQLTYVLQLVCMIIMAAFLWRHIPKDVQSPTRMKGFFFFIVCVSMVVGFLWFMPIDPELSNVVGRLSRFMLSSRVGFFMFSTIAFMGVSMAIMLGFVWFGVFLKVR